MSWGAEQLRILRELGHEPMLLASRVPEPAVVGAACADMRRQEASGDSLGVREEITRPKAAPTEMLAAAIARAADGRDLAGLALDLERLRREPSLKRALWPRLRALRRGR